MIGSLIFKQNYYQFLLKYILEKGIILGKIQFFIKS